MIKIQAILGSTRENRAGDKVASWLMSKLPALKGVEIELVDLKKWNQRRVCRIIKSIYSLFRFLSSTNVSSNEVRYLWHVPVTSISVKLLIESLDHFGLLLSILNE